MSNATSLALLILTASPRAPTRPNPGSLPGAYRCHTHYPGVSTLPLAGCGSPCAQSPPSCGGRQGNGRRAVDTIAPSALARRHPGCGERNAHVDEPRPRIVEKTLTVT